MANNLTQFKTDLKTAITANLDSGTQTKLGNRFLVAFDPAWDAYIAGGGTDTPANRRSFVVDRVFDWINNIYHKESYKENVAAMPAPEDIT